MIKIEFCDPSDMKRIIRRRRLIGAARFDEVWNGVYVMSPQPNPEHFIVAARLVHLLFTALEPSRIKAITGGGNISDRRDDWRKNYRSPDLMVFLADNQAEQLKSHWFGGPEFAVEIVSPRDRSRDKFEFYAKVGVRELLIVERKPWRLELYRTADGRFEEVGRSTLDDPAIVSSHELDLTFRLSPAAPRPTIEIGTQDGRTWSA